LERDGTGWGWLNYLKSWKMAGCLWVSQVEIEGTKMLSLRSTLTSKVWTSGQDVLSLIVLVDIRIISNELRKGLDDICLDTMVSIAELRRMTLLTHSGKILKHRLGTNSSIAN
jgi:hypothetical protein